MRRRALMTHRRAFVLGATAGLFLPANARAQNRRRIGVLLGSRMPALFADSLRGLGWSEGDNLEIVMRSTGGDEHKLAVLADELLGMELEVLVATNSQAALALFKRTRTVPIVISGVSNPIGSGLISSLARPGGNVTGCVADLNPLAGKFMEFSRELVPGLRRKGVLFNPENQGSARGYRMLKTLETKYGVELIPASVASPEQLDSALATLARESVQVINVHPAPPLNSHTVQIAEFAVRHRIPTLAYVADQVREGCLLSYGQDNDDVLRRTAYYVDRILRGAAPSDLPAELAKIRFTINLATVRALGITIPPSMFARADEVID